MRKRYKRGNIKSQAEKYLEILRRSGKLNIGSAGASAIVGMAIKIAAATSPILNNMWATLPTSVVDYLDEKNIQVIFAAPHTLKLYPLKKRFWDAVICVEMDKLLQQAGRVRTFSYVNWVEHFVEVTVHEKEN